MWAKHKQRNRIDILFPLEFHFRIAHVVNLLYVFIYVKCKMEQIVKLHSCVVDTTEISKSASARI